MGEELGMFQFGWQILLSFIYSSCVSEVKNALKNAWIVKIDDRKIINFLTAFSSKIPREVNHYLSDEILMFSSSGFLLTVPYYSTNQNMRLETAIVRVMLYG